MFFSYVFNSCLLSVRLLERVKETGQYTRQIQSRQQEQQGVKHDLDFNGIQTTINLLTNENSSS